MNNNSRGLEHVFNGWSTAVKRAHRPRRRLKWTETRTGNGYNGGSYDRGSLKIDSRFTSGAHHSSTEVDLADGGFTVGHDGDPGGEADGVVALEVTREEERRLRVL